MRTGATLLAVSAFTLASQAMASYPMMVANGSYSQVDFRHGNQNLSPDQMPFNGYSPASPDQGFSGGEGEKACARRENMPGSPNSGMSGWYCATGFQGIQQGQPVTTRF